MANYVILGKTFNNVAGIKVTDDNGNEVIYEVGGNSDLDKLLEHTLTSYSNSSVTALRNSLFRSQTNLTTVNVPNVTSVGNYCFDGCTSLTSLTTGQLSNIGQYAFKDSPITSINVSSSLTQIPDFAFAGSAITSIPNQNNLTRIGNSSFRACSGLTQVEIPSTVTYISSNAFSECTNLSKVRINLGSVTNIFGGTVFGSTPSLTKLTTADETGAIILPTTITATPSAVIQQSSVQTVDLSGCQSLTTISSAFAYNDNSLQSITLPDSVTTFDVNCFGAIQGQSFNTFVFPASTALIQQNVFAWSLHLSLLDFRRVLQVPTLQNTNAFSGISQGFQIVVPDALYEDWVAANNWSAYASHIVKASDYNPS